MAISWTDRGGATNTTSGLTFTWSPGSNFSGTAGSMGVVTVAVDNADTSGTAHSTFTLTDSLGNVWTRRTNPLNDPGAANAGIEGAFFTSDLAKGAPTTGTVFTLTFDANTTAKASMTFEASPDAAGKQVVYVTGGQSTGTGTTPSITTGTITDGNLVICGGHTEYGTSNTWTADADATNGSWSAQQTARAGTTTGGAGVGWQSKSVTATATQTYNPTFSASCDYALSWIELTQVHVRQYPRPSYVPQQRAACW